ncbi:hypothetical protein NRIC_10940 [Enterococcus florum]|uniref:Uncharacterized protein n=1 Tax=Enterococcus florum TaxID=2480627 RepID=A0A4P5PIL3_9ENTE|nr:hypothetical protein [Enterococcus florum]GCF93203.1 hypothetical protein NRIC_10940 [Enterococcus florum]
MKLGNLLKGSVLALGIAAAVFVGGADAFAARVDLGGYPAEIRTENAQNVIVTKRGKWKLDASTELYSSKNQTIVLKNTTPAQIDSIYATRCLTVKGNGELQAITQSGQYGINVGQTLNAFGGCGGGRGTLKAVGNEAGVRVRDLCIQAGKLNAEGPRYGIYADCNVKSYCTAVVNALATNDDSVGTWAGSSVIATSKGQIISEGGASGAYARNCYVKAECGGLLKGISRNLRSNLSALHAERTSLCACSKATLIEEYTYDPILNWQPRVPVNLTEYVAIRRNMAKVTNYRWSIEEGQGQILSVTPQGISMDNMINATLVGKRSTSCVKGEPTKLACCSQHIVRIKNIYMSVPVRMQAE